jgi:mannitol-1-phosphate 5-dehydrogenase
MNQSPKIVILGAGKIGRSFIGQLFSRGGYEVVFLDADLRFIDELNRRGSYNVIIKSETEQMLRIENVRGVSVFEEELAANEIAGADILAVCVGLNNLEKIMPLLSKGILKRYQLIPDFPLDMILAENLRDAADYFRTRLENSLTEIADLDSFIGLIETSIGKMVPIMKQKDLEEDPLQVFAESYNILIVDKKAFKNPIPDIEGLAPKDNMKAWVDRKLFIHNLGHAATAYFGYLYDPGFVFLYEPLKIKGIYNLVRDTMMQSADLLMKKYPGEFTPASLIAHIDDLLCRFQNVYLGDTLFRVGCDLFRKLGAQDRLAGAIHLALEMNLPCHLIYLALLSGFHFQAKDENGRILPGDEQFHEEIKKHGFRHPFKEVCGFQDEMLLTSGEKMYNSLDQEFFKRVVLKEEAVAM